MLTNHLLTLSHTEVVWLNGKQGYEVCLKSLCVCGKSLCLWQSYEASLLLSMSDLESFNCKYIFRLDGVNFTAETAVSSWHLLCWLESRWGRRWCGNTRKALANLFCWGECFILPIVPFGGGITSAAEKLLGIGKYDVCGRELWHSPSGWSSGADSGKEGQGRSSSVLDTK